MTDSDIVARIMDRLYEPDDIPECSKCDCDEGTIRGHDGDGRDTEDECDCKCHWSQSDAEAIAEDMAYERSREGA